MSNTLKEILFRRNSIFILNDNRADSNDSRTFGTIQQKDIVGNVVLRYYPGRSLGFHSTNN